MAIACSACWVGSAPAPAVPARTLKGRSSPWCALTTHSCTRELWKAGGGRQGVAREALEIREQSVAELAPAWQPPWRRFSPSHPPKDAHPSCATSHR